MRNRRAYTLVEVLVAIAVGLTVLAAAVALLGVVRRMTDVGDFSAALAEGAVAMEILHRDLSCAVQKPDPAMPDVVQLADGQPALQFILGALDGTGALTGTRVVYRREPLPSGNFRLLRVVGDGPPEPLPGVYSHIACDEHDGAGGPFLRITLHVVARDVATGKPGGKDEAVLTSLFRVKGPEMLHSGLVRFPFLDGLKSVELLKGQQGF